MPVNREKILVIGDGDRAVQTALRSAVPAAEVNAVPGVFEGIHELSRSNYSAVLAAAEPIERRPEAAVRTLRELVGRGRLVLFGHPTLEPLSRKMLEFGVDDYVVTPANAVELQQLFGAPALRVAPVDETAETVTDAAVSIPQTDRVASLLGLPLAELLLEALLSSPQNAFGAAVAAIDARIGPAMKLVQLSPTVAAPPPPDGMVTLSHPVWMEKTEKAVLHLTIPRDDDQVAARHFLSQLTHLLGRTILLQERHTGLQTLAITDELTGLYNARYFRHMLRKACDRAINQLRMVTLLMFDIDNFKKYNDEFGHALGDEILRQTASLMRRSCRAQDQVFRIAGDEFAVIFMENEPRAAHDRTTASSARVPASIRTILERFRRSISNPEFAMLGSAGRGQLTISGGMAIFPYHAHTPEELIQKADEALMFFAKKSGKNSIYLIGGEEPAA